MIYFDTAAKLQVKVSTGAPKIRASYARADADTHELLALKPVALTLSSSFQDLVPVAASGEENVLKAIGFQASTGQTLTIHWEDGSNDVEFTWALDAGDKLVFSEGHGFQVFTSSGAIKGGGSGGGGAIIVTEMDGVPMFAATTLKFSNGTVTDAGGGVAEITNTGGGGSSDDAFLFAFFMAKG